MLKDLLGVTVSPASVEALLKHTSTMLDSAPVQILEQLDHTPVRGADETSWPRAGDSGWLSVSIGEQAALFQIAARRDREAAIALFGEQPTGLFISDRDAVYLFIDDSQRQLCLACVASRLHRAGRA